MGDVEEMIGQLEEDEDEEEEPSEKKKEGEEGAFGLDLDQAWGGREQDE